MIQSMWNICVGCSIIHDNYNELIKQQKLINKLIYLTDLLWKAINSWLVFKSCPCIPYNLSMFN